MSACAASMELLGRMLLPESHWVLAAPLCWLAGTLWAELCLSLGCNISLHHAGVSRRCWVRKRIVCTPDFSLGLLMPLFGAPSSQECGWGRAELRTDWQTVSVLSCPWVEPWWPTACSNHSWPGFEGISPTSLWKQLFMEGKGAELLGLSVPLLLTLCISLWLLPWTSPWASVALGILCSRWVCSVTDEPGFAVSRCFLKQLQM